MAKRTLCQAPWCTQTARQAVAATGTSHQVLVCNDTVHERWANGQISEDFPGRPVEVEYLNNDELDSWLADDPNTVVVAGLDDDADGM